MSSSVRNVFWKVLYLPIHPFLVAALPAVHFFDLNLGLLEFRDLSKAVILAFALVGLLLLAGRWIWHSFHSAAMILTPISIILFKGNKLGPWWSLGFLVLGLSLGWILRRGPRQWPRQLSLPMNLAMMALIAMPLASAWRADYHDKAPQPTAFFQSEVPLPALSENRSRPDIYYILMDGLGQPTMIESEYPITRAEYSDLFSHRGFQVSFHSFANYPQTALSAASTMNMAPVQKILNIVDPNSKDRRILTKVIGHSRVVRTLRQWGYQVVDFPSGYPMTKQDLALHTRVGFWSPTFVEYYLIGEGILPLVSPLLGLGPSDVSFALRRERLNFIFDKLPSARQGIADADPVFVYAHILAPHPPFVFGPQGQPLKSRTEFGFADGNHWLDLHGRQDHSYRRRYADQAVWVMKRLADAVDGIMASSTRDKIIIIQGDHGPGSGLEWEEPENSDHFERFGIFNAWYVSSGQSVPLYDGITAMNTFPLLFNTIFDAELPLLADQLWFPRFSRPFVFTELSVDSLKTSN